MAAASHELITVTVKPLEALTDATRQAAFLAEIRKVTAAHVPDLKTEKGRKAIASLAYKVSRTKTAIAEVADEATAEWRAKTATVVDAKKLLLAELDSIRDETRKPLDDWEAEKTAQATLVEATTRRITEAAAILHADTPETVQARLDELREIVITDALYGEKAHITSVLHATTLDSLALAKQTLIKAQQDAAELDRLRQLEAELEAKERELQALRAQLAAAATPEAFTEPEAAPPAAEYLDVRAAALKALVEAAEDDFTMEPEAADGAGDEFLTIVEEFAVADAPFVARDESGVAYDAETGELIAEEPTAATQADGEGLTPREAAAVIYSRPTLTPEYELELAQVIATAMGLSFQRLQPDGDDLTQADLRRAARAAFDSVCGVLS